MHKEYLRYLTMMCPFPGECHIAFDKYGAIYAYNTDDSNVFVKIDGEYQLNVPEPIENILMAHLSNHEDEDYFGLAWDPEEGLIEDWEGTGIGAQLFCIPEIEKREHREYVENQLRWFLRIREEADARFPKIPLTQHVYLVKNNDFSLYFPDEDEHDYVVAVDDSYNVDSMRPGRQGIYDAREPFEKGFAPYYGLIFRQDLFDAASNKVAAKAVKAKVAA